MAKKKKKGFTSPVSNKSAVGEINVTPLIDIVLVLLIIYMVVTPVMLNQMSVDLPEKTETLEEDDIPEEQLLFAACLDGSYTFERKTEDLPSIVTIVKDRLEKKKKTTVVFIDSHPDVPYPQVVNLMDAVREAGKQSDYNVKIGLASLKEDKDFYACTPRPATPAPTPVPVAPEGGG